MDVLNMLKKLQDQQYHWESIFISIINYMTANMENCETKIRDVIEQANTIFNNDVKTWYRLLNQLEVHYSKTEQLDIRLTNLLVHHSNNLTDFRGLLLGKLSKP